MARRRRDGKVSHSQTSNVGPSYMPERKNDEDRTRQLRANTRPHLRRNPCNPCSAGRVELGFGLETPQPVDDLAAAAVGPGLFQDA
jgi:hypothetical protein